MSHALWWLGWVWALPITIPGMMLGVVTGSRCAWLNGVGGVWIASGWFRRNFFERFGVAAFCWGQSIHFRDERSVTPGTVAHELVHFKQARIFGVLLPLAYALGSLIAVAQGGHPYRDNFLERMARDESGH